MTRTIFSSLLNMALIIVLVFLEALNAYMTHAVNLSVADRTTSYAFVSCGSTGRTGPTTEQCREFYSSQPHNNTPFVNITMDDENMPGVQVWTVPKTNDYNVRMYGAAGSFGIETKTIPGFLRGYFGYSFPNPGTLPIWPTALHIKMHLTEGERIFIVVGQSGSMACHKDPGKNCKVESKSSEPGGGAGGGGASILYLERNGTITFVAVAGGGGGMGRKDSAPNQDYSKQEYGCNGKLCVENPIRPGLGGSLLHNHSEILFLPQDGRPLPWPFPFGRSLEGGQGCEEYIKYFDTQGGFGGGGGGCTAGGGGGGYVGGATSMDDSPELTGMQGSSHYNKELAEMDKWEQHAPFALSNPDGWVEITEVPPPCDDCEHMPCRWLDGTYTEYDCQCENEGWTPSHKLYSCSNTDESRPTNTLQDASVKQALIIICSVFAVIALGIIFVVMKKSRHCQWKKYSTSGHTRIKMDENPNYIICEGLPDVLSKERIKITRLLGEGKFSTVFEARLALTESWNSPEISVAVKKPKDNTVQTREEFLEEAKIISAFNHPNIMKIIGICELSDGIIGIAMDVLRGGDLLTFLKEHRSGQQTLPTRLQFSDLIKIASQIASACQYLEEKKFIHRDIAARNVLLTEKGPGRVAKISDFGLSRDINNGDYLRRNHSRPMPVRWYPPEAIKHLVQSAKSDVWSYGILLWEIFTFGEQPYSGLDNIQVAERIVNRHTMEPPSCCPSIIAELMRKCWMYDPQDRPDFVFVHLQISRLLDETLLTTSIHTTEGEMTLPVDDTKHPRLPSVTSSVSSGFDELPESPSCLSIKPLLDNSHHNGFENSMHT